MATAGGLDPSALFSAQGLVIVITGGGTGIGFDMATAAFRTGAAKVFILGRRLDVLTKAAKSLDETLERVVPIACDVASMDAVSAAAAHVEKTTGYIDVLVNNAGFISIMAGSNAPETVAELQANLLASHQHTVEVLTINSAAVVGVSLAFLQLLHKGNTRRGWPAARLKASDTHFRSLQGVAGVDDDDLRTSQIITISSIAAKDRGGGAGLAYPISKAAATHAGHIFSQLLTPYNIRSNIVEPGFYLAEWSQAHSGKAGAFANGGEFTTDGGRLHRFIPEELPRY